MSTMNIISIFVILAAAFGATTPNNRISDITIIKNNRDAFNASLDLMYLDRNQNLPAQDRNDNILRFFVIGDFGFYYHYRQVSSVTDSMNDLATKNHYDHIITVGDNIYEKGIEDINNRWKAWLVMSVFKKSALKNILIYPTLGNHDCYVDMYNEVKYSKYDYQWRLESDYYVKVTSLKDDPNKQFVNLMLNSWKILCPGARYQYDNSECAKFGIELGGPEVRAHYDWIEEQLKIYSQDPKTAWIAVTMHHQPYLHPGMKLHLMPLLKQYHVEILIVGHEHRSEYANQVYDHEWKYLESEYGPIVKNCTDREVFVTEIRETHQVFGERFHQFTVGNAGDKTDDPTCPLLDMDIDLVYRSTASLQTLSVEVTTDLFKGTFVNADGSVGYKVYIHKQKSSE